MSILFSIKQSRQGWEKSDPLTGPVPNPDLTCCTSAAIYSGWSWVRKNWPWVEQSWPLQFECKPSFNQVQLSILGCECNPCKTYLNFLNEARQPKFEPASNPILIRVHKITPAPGRGKTQVTCLILPIAAYFLGHLSATLWKKDSDPLLRKLIFYGLLFFFFWCVCVWWCCFETVLFVFGGVFRRIQKIFLQMVICKNYMKILKIKENF